MAVNKQPPQEVVIPELLLHG